MAKYKLNNEGSSVTDTESGMSIPLVGGNRHYAEFVAWIDDGNTPDPSITVKEFINTKKSSVKQAFESGAKDGFTTSSGIKYDAQLTDYVLLKGASDLAAIKGDTNIKVRDYNNKVHNISVTQFNNDIVEIASAYKIGMEAKWDAQDNADNSGYSQYAQGEIAKLMTIIAGNR